jgi:iron complex outermembrane receptor protein
MKKFESRLFLKRCLLWNALVPSLLMGGSDLLSYDLEDLSQLVVASNSASLTASSSRETPASVTIITYLDIEKSGARSLDELLDIYVPSFAYMYKVHGTQMGIRGIVSDRNNKILLLVNGRNMNVKATDGGAITERWTTDLADIYRVTVVSGPGSAVYGPGAIAGIISIETFDGFTFEGTDIKIGAGFETSFLSAQLRHGEKLSNGLGLFLYYGVDQASGADDDKAPHKIAFDLDANGNGLDIEANKNFPFPTTPDGASFHSKPRHKIHLQLDGDDFSLWSRYTQTGQAMPTQQNLYTYSPNVDYPEVFTNTGNEQKQWTLYGRYTQRIDAGLYIDYSASFMQSNLESVTRNAPESGKKWVEKDTTLDAVIHYDPDDRDAFAVGVSYDYTDFTNQRKLLPSNYNDRSGWYSDIFSLYGEYQGKFSDQVTVFAGMRCDKHRFSPWMFSPRLALIYMPSLDDTFKMIYNHSVRHADDADLYSIHLKTGNDGDVEKIDHLEGIFLHDFDPQNHLELSIFYNKHDVVAYNQTAGQQEYIGTLRFYGIEAQYRYEREDFTIFVSHSYTKELDFDLADPGIVYQNISASPYGYGDDLANWNDHISKARIEWQADPAILLSGSLRVFWGMPGAVDMADYNMAGPDTLLLLPLYSDGKRAFRESAFLDLGMQYRISEKAKFALYGYDLLGLFDEDLNKRNFFQRTSHYRDTAPSFAVWLTYRF